ncbi:MAG: hypothetical protein AUJ51_08270 [Elusimicrobia bacterium CG1_02_56_21]|nr:MAG: hypothetical protein AUJ51_08270 [Elusimicrobia bacterium CG1_02_56_21]
MTKSKTFWAASALISLALMVFAGYSIYGRVALHFSGDTIEVKPVPLPAAEEQEEEKVDTKSALEKIKAAEKEDKEEEAKAGRGTPAKTEVPRMRAVKTAFEYKDSAAKSVLISGSFTSWKDKKMTKKDGVWKTDIYILPGTYPYHYTVDGKKKLAPGKPKAPTGDSLVTVN